MHFETFDALKQWVCTIWEGSDAESPTEDPCFRCPDCGQLVLEVLFNDSFDHCPHCNFAYFEVGVSDFRTRPANEGKSDSDILAALGIPGVR